MADHEFVCGSPVCDTRLVAATRNDLMSEVAQHVKVKHRVPAPTRSLVRYVEATMIREILPTPGDRR